eukprot:5310156-Pyramimonas_sp.AAC.1
MGSDHYLGISERLGGAQLVPSLRAHVATELSKEAAILKEKREAREARAAGVAVAKAKAGPSAPAKKLRSERGRCRKSPSPSLTRWLA